MLSSQIANKLTTRAKNSLLHAEEIARFCKSPSTEPEHLLFAIFLEDGSVGSNLLKNMRLKKNSFERVLFDSISPIISVSAATRQPLSSLLKKMITRAYALAHSFHYPYVGTEHLVYAVMESPTDTIKKIFSSATIPSKPMDFMLSGTMPKEILARLSKILDVPENILQDDTHVHAPHSQTPHLDQFAVNLTLTPEEPMIGREQEQERMIAILGRKQKNNPLLVGAPGVGKTALVTHLAHRIAHGTVPPELLGKKILSVDMALLVAGTSFRGEFEARLKDVLAEAKAHPEIILFIDEIHTIVGTGNANGSLDAANILKPALSRSEIRCIGATTFEEYKKYIEKDAALERRFQPIQLAEPTPEEATRIVEGAKESYEKFHNVTLPAETIAWAVDAGVRYFPDRFLPDKAFDIIDEAASRKRTGIHGTNTLLHRIKKMERALEAILKKKQELVSHERYEDAAALRVRETLIVQKLARCRTAVRAEEKRRAITLSREDINHTIATMTGIPVEKIAATSFAKLSFLHSTLPKKIIGQKEATDELCAALARSYSGIAHPNRPIGSFLFLGPSGVGKTLTAKILAQELFDDARALIRIDMSELMERHSVARLIGAPAGYVGYGEGGRLTEQIRRRPYSVLLFDEIEKAHPDVFNILLQVLEDGRLTDADGKTVDFTHTVIILTSNLGTEAFSAHVQFGFGQTGRAHTTANDALIKNKVLTELRGTIKPELLNRLDRIIVFRALTQTDLHAIAKLEMDHLRTRLERNKITLTHTPAVTRMISERSNVPREGARAVRTFIQNTVENAIAQHILRTPKRPLRVAADIVNDTLTIV